MKAELSNYVSNLDKDIYTVYNLPEEVIATIFAYVSRSPLSFRENLLKVTEEKAKQFHEKWVLNYGHASVAELATVHIGIERVSRLFSALLERSNLFISPIEYSQRYQKPKRGDFYTPIELDAPKYESLKKEFIDYQYRLYDDYTRLYDLLLTHYHKTESKKDNEKDKAYESRIAKASFEDARYLLSLATHTNLGLTANARAMEDSLVHLLSSEYPEVRQRGEEIKGQVVYALPTLVKYAKANLFLSESRKYLKEHQEVFSKQENTSTHPSVTLLHYTTKGSTHPEEKALNIILPELLYQYSTMSLDSLKGLMKEKSQGDKLKLFSEALSSLGNHDNPPQAFEAISYKMELTLSESCWHQLLRHRKIRFAWQYPNMDHGYRIPPKVIEAGGKDLFTEVMTYSQRIYTQLKDGLPLVAHYTITNAHYRRVIGEFTLWELYHLIHLRMTHQAQWEIRELVTEILSEIQKVHPNLVQPALDHLSGH